MQHFYLNAFLKQNKLVISCETTSKHFNFINVYKNVKLVECNNYKTR